jgi:hypothetical protein
MESVPRRRILRRTPKFFVLILSGDFGRIILRALKGSLLLNAIRFDDSIYASPPTSV